MNRSLFITYCLTLVAATAFAAIAPISAKAEIRFFSAGGSKASAPVKGDDLRRIELGKGDPAMPGMRTIHVVTRSGQVYELALSGGPLVRVEFTPGHVPPPPVPETPNQEPDSAFGCGEASYADTLVVYTPGTPAASKKFTRPQAATGRPDGLATSLGCGGDIVLAWDNAYLMDVPGPDLRLATAMLAPNEPEEFVRVFLRLDDSGQWTDCGILREGQELDINGCTPPGMRYNQVRLQDSGEDCQWPATGADVDAVQFLGCVGGQ